MRGGEVLISGMGVVAPNGATLADFWASNLTGRSGLRVEDRMDLSGLPCGWVSGIIPDDIRAAVRATYGRPGRSWTDTLMHASVDQALLDAGIGSGLDRPAGLVFVRIWPGASGSDPQDYADDLKNTASRVLRSRGDPRLMTAYLRSEPLPAEIDDSSAFPAEVSRRLGVPVLCTRLEATCAGGLRAIAEASRLLLTGRADVAVVAAAVSRNTPYLMSQYGQMMALSRWKGDPAYASTPFDRRRSGMVISESAGALVLETAEHARRRGAEQSYATVAGWGLAVDTTHVTAPQVDSVESVMRRAMAEAGVSAADVDTVNAHGTSTRLNDITEARALHRLFGERMAGLDVSAVKSLTGHGSAASGVIESAVAALTLCHDVIPPVVTCTEPDPECAVHTSLTAVHRPVRTVLKNSFGFGGQYASMVFRKPPNPRRLASAQV